MNKSELKDLAGKKNILDTKKILEAGKVSAIEFIKEYVNQTPYFKLLISADNPEKLKSAVTALFKEDSERYLKVLEEPNSYQENDVIFKEVYYHVSPTVPAGVTRENLDPVFDAMKEANKLRILFVQSILREKSSLYLTTTELCKDDFSGKIKKISPKELAFLPHVWLQFEETSDEYKFYLIRCFFATCGTVLTIPKERKEK